jgi:hypothetical protein
VAHLHLVLEVRDLPQALDDRLGADAPASASASRMNPRRSSIVNIAVLFRADWFTTATTTSSNRPAARLMMSRWPFVTGS